MKTTAGLIYESINGGIKSNNMQQEDERKLNIFWSLISVYKEKRHVYFRWM